MNDWNQRYEEALAYMVETKNEYDFLCQQHHVLIQLVKHIKDAMDTIKRLLHTCKPEDYAVLEDQYHRLFNEWNHHSTIVETLTGQRYREMIHASEYASILLRRHYV